MYRFRLIATGILLYFYLLMSFPVQTIVCSLFLIFGYIIIRNIGNSQTTLTGDAIRRRFALREASIYLAPYSDIWRNLRLSNKYCSLKLGYDGSTISAQELTESHRSFRIIRSKIHSNSDLWDMFCLGFSHNTTFDGLVQLCGTYQAEIAITGEREQENKIVKNGDSQTFNAEKNQPKTNDTVQEKLDINNASEVEITALPGISIVTAKKLIKKREEIGGFKSVNDVFLFLKLKPHMQTQLEQLICVKKMKGSIKIKRYDERSVDL